MTLQDLNLQLSNALKKYIKDRDHIITGDLYRSVLFNCHYQGEYLILNFSSMFYIKFLEYGDFTNDFFNLQSTNDIISNFIISQVI